MRSSLTGSFPKPSVRDSYTRLGRVGRRTSFDFRLNYSAPCFSRVKCIICFARRRIPAEMLWDRPLLNTRLYHNKVLGDVSGFVNFPRVFEPARWRRAFAAALSQTTHRSHEG